MVKMNSYSYLRQYSNRTITQDGNGDGCGFTSHGRTPKARKFLSRKCKVGPKKNFSLGSQLQNTNDQSDSHLPAIISGIK